MRVPAVGGMARRAPLLEIAQEILGHGAFPYRATLFDKSATANWLVVWHQDTALPLRERREVPGWGPWSVKEGVHYAHAPASALEQVLALRVHLDDSTSKNGPLRVLPGQTGCKGVRETVGVGRTRAASSRRTPKEDASPEALRKKTERGKDAGLPDTNRRDPINRGKARRSESKELKRDFSPRKSVRGAKSTLRSK